MKLLPVVLALSAAGTASAVTIQIQIENLASAGGIAFSPFFLAAHDGTFDTFDSAAAASSAIEAVAELGDASGLVSAFSSAQPGGMSGVATATMGGFGPGIYLPGATGTLTMNLDPVMNRYLSFGAMAVPSNDYFVGNASPTAIELFDASGNFLAPSFDILAGMIWNAGTEVTDPTTAAFIVGASTAGGTAEGGMIDLNASFAAFVGMDTPAGYTFTAVPGASDAVVRISAVAVPEPSTYGVIAGAVLLGFVVTRRAMRRWREAA